MASGSARSSSRGTRTLPSYDELPRDPDGVPCAWDAVGGNPAGLVGLLGPAHARRAADVVVSGASYALNAPLDFLDPPLFERAPARHEVRVSPWETGMNDALHDFDPQSSSHWDALAHVGARGGVFYGGASVDDLRHDGVNGIGHVAARGIVGRGVLLDLERALPSYDPGSSHGFTVEELEAARVAAGIEFEPGDVVLLRTGWMRWYSGLERAERERISDRTVLRACGVEHSEAMARYLWDTGAFAIACDCPALEVWPTAPEVVPFGVLHRLLIGQFGMTLGELFWLEDLADACAADGRHEFMFTSAPMAVRTGVSSPANAIAIR